MTDHAPQSEDGSSETSDDGNDGESYPANTMVLNFIPDTSAQLDTTFTCSSDIWGAALGSSGSYEPTDSTDVLFSWSNSTASYILDFYADGTYQYQFTSMSVIEAGTWNFENWTMTTTTANGNSFTAEIAK